MKRIIILLLSIWMGITAYALNKQTLADTLTAYAKSKAYVGNVNVQRVRVRNQLVWVYTNGTLGQLSLTPNDVRELQKQKVHIWDEWMQEDGTIGTAYGWVIKEYEQVDKLLHQLKTNPQDRRMMVNLWQILSASSSDISLATSLNQ